MGCPLAIQDNKAIAMDFMVSNEVVSLSVFAMKERDYERMVVDGGRQVE